MKKILVLIIAVICVFIAGTVLIGQRTFEGLVVQKPYETGLQWDESRRQNETLGWKVIVSPREFVHGTNSLDISVSDRAGKPLEDLAVTVITARPATASYDRSYPAVSAGNGHYRTEIELPVHGFWDLSIEAKQNANICRYQERISVAQQQQGISKNSGTDCEISSGPCRKTMGGMTVSFEILPRPAAAMKNLGFVIELSEGGKPAADAEVDLDLTMPGMIMGHNRPALKHAGGGRYEGTGVIVRCPSGKNFWKADLQIKRQGKTLPVEFLFEVL